MQYILNILHITLPENIAMGAGKIVQTVKLVGKII